MKRAGPDAAPVGEAPRAVRSLPAGIRGGLRLTRSTVRPNGCLWQIGSGAARRLLSAARRFAIIPPLGKEPYARNDDYSAALVALATAALATGVAVAQEPPAGLRRSNFRRLAARRRNLPPMGCAVGICPVGNRTARQRAADARQSCPRGSKGPQWGSTGMDGGGWAVWERGTGLCGHWYPSRPVAGTVNQGDFGLVRQDLSAVAAVWRSASGGDGIVLSAGVRNSLVFTDAVLPDSIGRFPTICGACVSDRPTFTASTTAGPAAWDSTSARPATSRSTASTS